MTEDREIWRWVIGYEGLYMVSNKGGVMSVPSTQQKGRTTYKKSGLRIRDQNNGHGYRVVNLCKDGSHHQLLVHRVVAMAFIPNPGNLPEVNHKDGNKSNNSVENLEWVTRKENIRHAVDVLEAFRFNERFTEDEVLAIRSDDRTESEIADEYGVGQPTINAIRTGKTYKRIGGRTQRVGRKRQRKLTAAQVRDIRTSTLTGVELASIYGVAPGTICKIKKYQRYKEVSDE